MIEASVRPVRSISNVIPRSVSQPSRLKSSHGFVNMSSAALNCQTEKPHMSQIENQLSLKTSDNDVARS